MSPAKARFLVTLPGFSDAFYREVGSSGVQLPADIEEFFAICDRHAVRIP